MNRKGFTLIELIAVIVIMGIILVVAAPNILNVYNDSRLKSEKIFTERISQVADSYVSLNSDMIGFSYYGVMSKTEEGKGYDVTVDRGMITMQDIINYDLISKEKYVNSGNKEVACNLNAEIEVYRDNEYVYCHKIRKENLGCLTREYMDSIGEYAVDTCVWSSK